MKKLFVLLFAVATMAILSVSALAATPIDGDGNTSATDKSEGDYSIGVSGTYQAGSAATPTISVDIVWESMSFTYTAGQGIYSPENHKTTAGAGSWSTDKKYIEVKNHSNVGITASFSFTAGTDVTTTGSFYDKADATTALASDKQSFTLVSGEDKTTEGQTYTVPSNKIYFGVSGAGIDADKALGNITVQIQASFTYDVAVDGSANLTSSLTAALNAGIKNLVITLSRCRPMIRTVYMLPPLH